MDEIEHKVRVACGLDFEDEPVGVAVDVPADAALGDVSDAPKA